MSTTLGRNIKAFRKNRGFTQEELAFFESGFDKMKEVISENEKSLFRSVGKFLYTISMNNGWYEEKSEALRVCTWCEDIVKAFATRRDSLEYPQYLSLRSFIIFHKMVAFHRAGENDKAKEVYDSYKAELDAMDITAEQKKDALDRLDHEVEFHKIFG